VAFLSATDQEFLQKEFAALARDVPLTLVTHESMVVVPGDEVPYGREVRLLLEEVAAMSPHIKLDVKDVRPSEAEKLQALGVTRLPALLFGGAPGARARYLGVPSGYELSTVIAAILELGRQADGGSALKPDVVEKLGALGQDVHIQVFVTPT